MIPPGPPATTDTFSARAVWFRLLPTRPSAPNHARSIPPRGPLPATPSEAPPSDVDDPDGASVEGVDRAPDNPRRATLSATTARTHVAVCAYPAAAAAACQLARSAAVSRTTTPDPRRSPDDPDDPDDPDGASVEGDDGAPVDPDDALVGAPVGTADDRELDPPTTATTPLLSDASVASQDTPARSAARTGRGAGR